MKKNTKWSLTNFFELNIIDYINKNGEIEEIRRS